MLHRAAGATVLAACVIASVGTLVAEEPSPDVLISDSFEEGKNVPDGWEQGPAVPGVKYVYERSVASEGKRSLSLQKSEKRYFPIAGWMRMLPYGSEKSVLRVAAKVKASSVTKAIIEVQFFGPNAQFLSKEWAAYIGQKNPKDPVATHDWKTYGDVVKIPAGTKQIAIALQIYGPGKVWFDELEARYFDSLDAAKTDAPPVTVPTEANRNSAETPMPIEIRTPSGGRAQYLLIPPREGSAKPQAGYPLLLVLPGGDGSAEFHPFVRSIHQQALDGRCIIAQPLAPPQIVWPTRASADRMMTTEETIAAIIDHIAGTLSVDRAQVYALGWSSSGPALYATILQEKTPLAGAFIAMSVFKPDQLPPLAYAKGRRIYLLHSPDDKVCPYGMAKGALDQLTAAGAKVTLVDYPGGHGWHGPVHDNIRAGVEWLQKSESR